MVNLTFNLTKSEKFSLVVFVSLFDDIFVDCKCPLSGVLLSFEGKYEELQEERGEDCAIIR